MNYTVPPIKLVLGMRWRDSADNSARQQCAWSPYFVIAGSLICGIILRLVWPEDIEFKGDERWMFEHASALLSGVAWSWVSLPTSLGSPNPGLSLWIFSGLAYVSAAQTGPELARAVQWLNVLALLAFALFAGIAVAREAREKWLWASALWAVNPLAIIFERKIWPPSLLPLASVALITCWWYRKHATISFLCGLICVLMVQVHLGVIFLAAALFAWTWLFDGASFRWGAWITGASIGSLPALPWLLVATQESGKAALRWRFPMPHFFYRWVSQPFGFGVEYTLGWQDFLDYLSCPWLAGIPTFAMLLTHAVLVFVFVVVLVHAARVFIVVPRVSTHAMIIGNSPESVLVNALLFGYGGLLTLITLIGPGSHRHYLIVAVPVMALWCVRLIWTDEQGNRWRWSRFILVVLCLAQAIASAGLIHYIHRTQVINGDYGRTWRFQNMNNLPARTY